MAATATKKSLSAPGGISSEAVNKATGKTWEQWIRALDKESAHEKPHREIAVLVCEKFGLNGWWSQMVTVGYEQAKGLRVKHQRGKTFDISATRTISFPVGRVFAAWADDKNRSKWLKEKFLVVRTAVKNKSMRFTWKDGKQVLIVNFYVIEPSKCRITVDHTKLENEKAALAMKKYWKEKLTSLVNWLGN